MMELSEVTIALHKSLINLYYFTNHVKNLFHLFGGIAKSELRQCFVPHV